MATQYPIYQTEFDAGTGTSQAYNQTTYTPPTSQSDPPKPTALPTQQSSNETSHSSILPPLSKTMDWTIKVLGVAAALVFGIWAPISYQASEDSNIDTDKKFSSIYDQLSSWQTSAASLQASAAKDMSIMSKKMDFVGTLSVYDFCQGQSSIPACVSVTRSLDVNALVSSIVPSIERSLAPSRTSTFAPSPSFSTTPVSGPPPPPPGSSSSKGGAVSLTTPAILGIVFGIVVFLGLVIGFIAWKRSDIKRNARRNVF